MDSIRVLSRLNLMAVLNVVLFWMYLVSSRLFHSNGRLYSGDFLKSSVCGFGSIKLSALRSGLSPWLMWFFVQMSVNEDGAYMYSIECMKSNLDCLTISS